MASDLLNNEKIFDKDEYLQEAIYLFNCGKSEKAYQLLGAHPKSSSFVFRVWAPNAYKVFVVGDFNQWRIDEAYAMQVVENQGIWVLELQQPRMGDKYKYAIFGADGRVQYKIDPFAVRFELRPDNACVLSEFSSFEWTDAEFMASRPLARANNFPLNIYEVHLGSWRRKDDNSFMSYRELAFELGAYLQEMSYTHVELMPIMEHPLDASWGYQLIGFFAPTSRYGEITDFMFLIDYLHSLNIGVILDWVPAHFPKDDFALANYDGSPCFEYADPKLGEQIEWGTKIFDFAKTQVRSFLFSSAFYWLEVFHIDGLRFDAVSTILYRNYAQQDYSPNIFGGRENLEGIDFLKELCSRIELKYPQVLLIAEESTTFPNLTSSTDNNGVGFNYKWDMGWMHDTLDYCAKDYIYRPWHHNMITFSMSYAFSERFVLPLSHDEVVHGKKSLIDKMPGDYWRKFASLRNLYTYMMGHPGAKLLFMGGEFAQFIEWRFYEQLEWFMLEHEYHAKFHNFCKRLNYLYKTYPAFWQIDTNWHGFQWLDCDDAARSCYAFVREDEAHNQLYFILNMTPAPIENYILKVHQDGKYYLLLNTDQAEFGGSSYSVIQGDEEYIMACIVTKEYEVQEQKEELLSKKKINELREKYPESLWDIKIKESSIKSVIVKKIEYSYYLKIKVPPLATLIFEYKR